MKKIATREELAQMANLLKENGNEVMVYEPNGTQFQIIKSYRDPNVAEGTKGRQTFYDVKVCVNGEWVTYYGKPSSDYGKMISGESSSRGTRAKKEKEPETAHAKMESLKAKYESLKAEIEAIEETVGYDWTETETGPEMVMRWQAYEEKLEAEMRAEEVANTAKKFTKAELMQMLAMCEEE